MGLPEGRLSILVQQGDDMSEQAIVVRANGEIEEVLIPAEGEDGRLNKLQEFVGGYIERVPTGYGLIYVNEEGWMKGLSMNITLMMLLRGSQPLLGDAIILPDDTEHPLHRTLRQNLELLLNDSAEYQFFEGEEE